MQRRRNQLISTTTRLLAAALLLGASAHHVCAQANLIERNVSASPGRDVRVGVYTTIRPDCTSGPLPAIWLVNAPAHGAVNVKRATFKATNFKQCLAVEVPALVAFYRAAAGFNGADDFQLEVTFAGGRKEIQHFQVSVSNAPSGGQSI
jgi:hypothetical protein